MKTHELSKLQRVEFRLAGKLVQGLVVGDKRKRVVVMKDHGGDWRPIFIPIGLLNHITFRHAYNLFMPVYNPIMEGILKQAREGRTDGW